MKLFEPPQEVDLNDPNPIVFLAGSIEMGAAENWQEQVIQFLDNREITILNPRRKEWDSTWQQNKDDKRFLEQVQWELDGLEMADIIVYYFDPQTKSPITLMELGLYARTNRKILVCCPEGYWKKGNVDIVCERYGLRQYDTLTELIVALRHIEETYPREA